MIPVPAVRLVTRTESGRTWPLLVWAPGPGWRAVSSGIVRAAAWARAAGGSTRRSTRSTSTPTRSRTHARSRPASAWHRTPASPCSRPLTSRRWVSTDDGGVTVAATVGLGLPVLAAVPPEIARPGGRRAGRHDQPAGRRPRPAVGRRARQRRRHRDGGEGAGAGRGRSAGDRHLLGRRLRRVPRADVGGPRAVRRAPLAVGRAASPAPCTPPSPPAPRTGSRVCRSRVTHCPDERRLVRHPDQPARRPRPRPNAGHDPSAGRPAVRTAWTHLAPRWAGSCSRPTAPP